MRKEPSLTLIAHKAINLCDDLSESEKRVAAVIIDHYNRKTGQCDPSLETIARLAGVSRRTVIRAVGGLAKKGYMRNYRHGGKYHRNQYEPDWAHFREVEARWNAKRRKNANSEAVTDLSPLQGLRCHTGGDACVTQTPSKNSLKEETLATERAKQCRSYLRIAGQGLSKEVKSKPSYGAVGERFHVKSTSSQSAAYDAAERRWNNLLMKQLRGAPDVFAPLIEKIDLDLQRTTTEMELRRPGSGLPFLLGELDRRVSLGGAAGESAVDRSTVPSSDLARAGNSDRERSPASPDFRSLNTLKSKPKEEP